METLITMEKIKMMKNIRKCLTNGGLRWTHITIKYKIMKTKEELQAMSHRELVEYALEKQGDIITACDYQSRCKRLEDILSAIGIVYETYRRDQL